MLEGFNYLKLATELRVAVSQLKGNLCAENAQEALTHLASALLDGVLEAAAREIAAQARRFSTEKCVMAIVGYGSLGAFELGL